MRYDSAKISFVYSFGFELREPISRLRTGEGIGQLAEGRPPERVGMPANLRLRGAKTEVFWRTELPASTSLQGLLPRWDRSGGELRLGGNPAGEIIVRLFKTGAGTVTVGLNLDGEGDPLDTLDLLRVYGVINSTDVETYKYPTILMDGSEKRLVDLVVESIGKVRELVASSTDGPPPVWLDKELLDPSMAELDYQNPYLVVSAKLIREADSGDPCWCEWGEGKPRGRSRELLEAIMLLYRYVRGATLLNRRAPAYDLAQVPDSERTTGRPIRNFSWHRDIFVGLHSRAALLLSHPLSPGSENGADLQSMLDEISRLLHESTLDLIEVAKARWHLGVILNELLDRDLDLLRREPDPENLRYLDKLIARRRQYALFLSDPLTYSFEGGLLFDLHQHARGKFFLAELEASLASKFAALDGFFEDSRAYFSLHDFFQRNRAVSVTDLARVLDGVDGELGGN